MALVIIIALFCSLIGNQQYSQSNKQSMQINAPVVVKYEVLGNTSNGTVIKSGPYGNPNSTRRIAVIVGVHPLELNSHKAMAESILILSESLNSSYYIYSIDVTKDVGNYNRGRMNGQLLAHKYAVPDIKKNNFKLVIDVHSNRGKYADYEKIRFLSVPLNASKSKLIASRIITKIPWLVYYIPPKGKGPRSPRYVTIPLIRSGIHSIVYETYMYEPYETTRKHAIEFIKTVDNTKLS